jgi:uncharacterized surface protein with fasciclin (FAS1) repeats
MKTIFKSWPAILKTIVVAFMVAGVFSSCAKKDLSQDTTASEIAANEQSAVSNAKSLEQSVPANAQKEGSTIFKEDATNGSQGKKTIVGIVSSNPNFTALVAAVVKTGLAETLSSSQVNLTVFAPTNTAFAQLPAPFNNVNNISGITDASQIAFLKSVLLYHVLGIEVFSNQIANGPSSVVTLKTKGDKNDNTIYLSKTFGFIRINGQSSVIFANANASNGVVHVIDKVLLFPTKSLGEVVSATPALSTLLAALIKTNLASTFFASGDYTVFAPTNAAFAKLPAPFNNDGNIGAISNPAQIATLANILKYHVLASRNFAWDLGILKRNTTIADAPNNKITTILGYNNGYVKGDGNNIYSFINPADILANNGVAHVIDQVLLPKSN